jgi:hypothetical protein
LANAFASCPRGEEVKQPEKSLPAQSGVVVAARLDFTVQTGSNFTVRKVHGENWPASFVKRNHVDGWRLTLCGQLASSNQLANVLNPAHRRPRKLKMEAMQGRALVLGQSKRRVVVPYRFDVQPL